MRSLARANEYVGERVRRFKLAYVTDRQEAGQHTLIRLCEILVRCVATTWLRTASRHRVRATTSSRPRYAGQPPFFKLQNTAFSTYFPHSSREYLVCSCYLGVHRTRCPCVLIMLTRSCSVVGLHGPLIRWSGALESRLMDKCKDISPVM